MATFEEAHTAFLDEELRTRDAAIIVDLGTDSCRVGFSSSNWESLQSLSQSHSYPLRIPSIVGKPKQPDTPGKLFRDRYVGSAAQEHREICDLIYPITRGSIADWDSLELMLQYIFDNELTALPKDYPVVLGEPLFTNKLYREQAVQIFFETFDCPYFHVAPQPLLDMFSFGRTTGIVIDVGEGVTDIVPVLDGVPVQHAMRRVNLAGCDITKQTQKRLAARGKEVTLEEARKIKESKVATATELGFEEKEEPAATGQDTFSAKLVAHARAENPLSPSSATQANTVPAKAKPKYDEHTYAVAHNAANILFDPPADLQEDSHLVQGIHTAAYQALLACDVTFRDLMLQNIVVCGGTFLMPGLVKRFEEKFRKLLPGKLTELATFAGVPEYMPFNAFQYASWHGAAILASEPRAFQQVWVSKQDYNDFGPYAVWKG
eukprot:Rmarinus@m.21949